MGKIIPRDPIDSNLTSQKILGIFKRIMPQLVGLGSVLILWQLGAMQYGSVVLPTPLETGTAIVGLATTGKLANAVLNTSIHLSIGFTIAVVLGIILGIVAGIKSWFRQGISPIVSGLQGIPPIAWIVLSLLWFGSGRATPIFTIAIATIPIIFLAAVEGIKNFPTPLLEMARMFRSPRGMLLTDLYFPHLFSYIFPSVTAGLGLAWRVAVMAELLSSEIGIGAELNLARINLDTDEVMAWIAIVVISIWIGEYLILRPLRDRFIPWRN